MLPEYDSNDEYADLSCPECGEEERIEWDISGEWIHCHGCGHDWHPGEYDDYDDWEDR